MNGKFRISMTWLHTWAGLVFCWLLYFLFVTGTLGYFDSEIDLWMTPEAAVAEPTPLDADTIRAVSQGRSWARLTRIVHDGRNTVTPFARRTGFGLPELP